MYMDPDDLFLTSFSTLSLQQQQQQQQHGVTAPPLAASPATSRSHRHHEQYHRHHCRDSSLSSSSTNGNGTGVPMSSAGDRASSSIASSSSESSSSTSSSSHQHHHLPPSNNPNNYHGAPSSGSKRRSMKISEYLGQQATLLPPIAARFVHPIPDELKCPICFELLADPVITRECGHTFCRDCLAKCIAAARSSSKCPTCRADYDRQVQPNRNHVVGSLVENILVWCRYAMMRTTAPPLCSSSTDEEGEEPEGTWILNPDGCKTHLPRSRIRQHESVCPFAPVACTHRRVGCRFIGTRAQLDAHLENCHFEAMHDYIASTEEEIAELKFAVREQSMEINLLRQLLRKTLQALEDHSDDVAELRKIADITRTGCHLRPHNGGRRQGNLADQLANQLFASHEVCRCKTLTLHEDTVESLVYSQDLLFSASWDHTIRAWDRETFECTYTLQCSADVRELLVDGSRLYCGCGNGNIQVWDLETRKCLLSQHAHEEDVLALRMCRGRLFSSGSDTKVKAWDPLTMNCLGTLGAHSNWVFALASTDDYLFSGSSDSSIRVWNPDTFQLIGTLAGHRDQVRALVATDTELYSGSYDSTVRVWDAKQLRCIRIIDVHNEVFGLGLAGDYLLSGDENGTIVVWDRFTYQRVHTLADHTGSVYSFAMVGNKLLSASSDMTVIIWGAADK